MTNTQKTYPRDVLLNLLAIVALYVSVFTFLSLVFDYINAALPDPLNPYYDPASAIRWPLSVIIIVFPLYVFTSRFLLRDIKNNPEKNDSRLRRWLVYVTIFASGALIAGDLIALVYNFLQGELTWSFIFKVLAIFAAAAMIFGYHWYLLKKKPEEFSLRTKILVWLVAAVVLAAVIYGFVLAGSPFRQRLVRFDERKAGDLQVLQSYVVNYWIQKQELPLSLNALVDSISGFIPPADPQSGESYVYKITGDLSFELCAEFNLDSAKTTLANNPVYAPLEAPLSVRPLGGVEENWSHKSGQQCFERTIDPDLYKKQNNG